ncbi:hypothetical protein M5I08_22620 [Candidatus Mycobacterium methanotrophicum]|uniref:Uncharacterized protein n=2 Tax=Candidatus Mycobacterium methanotrophicum TaxID=2943498 RepID=A0ABY4QRZ9_9MYCO|nr:hypothetical protein [Candidatus Mycobacterium methanotrophicum]UQX13292.1 hypothetical protein M5I08_22620 [Candidatus Mycobacterium methanotrophicum]
MVLTLACLAACSASAHNDRVYGALTARLGESLAVLGWNPSMSNLRWQDDYVLVDVDAAPGDPAKAHADARDVRFGLYRALAHPIEATGVGSCDNVKNVVIQSLLATGGKRLTGTVRLPTKENDTGLVVKTSGVAAWRADGAQLTAASLGDPAAFTGQGYMLLGLDADTIAARYRDDSAARGGPMMLLATPTLPAPGLNLACSAYGSSALILAHASRDAVHVSASLCTQGDINQAPLYATVAVAGTHAAVWTTR